MAVRIKAVTLAPNPVNVSQMVSITVTADEISWNSIKSEYVSWLSIRNSFTNWTAVKNG